MYRPFLFLFFFKWIFVGHCGSLWIVVGRFGSLWIVTWWFILGRFGSFWVVPRFSNYAKPSEWFNVITSYSLCVNLILILLFFLFPFIA